MTKRKIKIEKQKVKDLNLDYLEPLAIETNGFSDTGTEAFKFYAYMSTLVDNTTIVEVGTRAGRSALALSHNETNKIISFDILEQGASDIIKDNILFVIDDFMSYSVDWDFVDMIMIDVDPHDGIKERVFFDFLKNKIRWEGLLILDDILPNWPAHNMGADPVAMNIWWNSIEEEKYDFSDVGHFSGTGLVNLGSKFEIEVID
jgi:predicted O-methyltransferase YrrM